MATPTPAGAGHPWADRPVLYSGNSPRSNRALQMHPAVVLSQSHILAREDDFSAPPTDLADRTCLVFFGIDVQQLPILDLLLLHHSLGRVLSFIRQEALILLPHALGPLLAELFPAVLGRYSHHRYQPFVMPRQLF